MSCQNHECPFYIADCPAQDGCAGCIPQQTNGDIILSDVTDIECLAELIWCDGWHEAFNMPDFSTKQELLEWLQQPKEESPL